MVIFFGQGMWNHLLFFSPEHFLNSPWKLAKLHASTSKYLDWNISLIKFNKITIIVFKFLWWIWRAVILQQMKMKYFWVSMQSKQILIKSGSLLFKQRKQKRMNRDFNPLNDVQRFIVNVAKINVKRIRILWKFE